MTNNDQEAKRKIALVDLNGELWKYAMPLFATPKQFGELGEGIEKIYNTNLKQAPSQYIWEKLCYSQLNGENGALTSQYMKNTAAQIISEAIDYIKVGDATNQVGVKSPVAENYSGKYVSELGEEQREQVRSTIITNKVGKTLIGLLDIGNKASAKALEEMFCQPAEDTE